MRLDSSSALNFVVGSAMAACWVSSYRVRRVNIVPAFSRPTLMRDWMRREKLKMEV
jgi:hypothetical protein